VDEGALVACCRAVAAHTGRLQISSKVKADTHSVAQPKVDKAAKLVKDSTNELLNETKRVRELTSDSFLTLLTLPTLLTLF
jgi:hypothetical protein